MATAEILASSGWRASVRGIGKDLAFFLGAGEFCFKLNLSNLVLVRTRERDECKCMNEPTSRGEDCLSTPTILHCT